MAGGIGETARLIATLELQDKFSKGIGSATLSLGKLESSFGRMGRGASQVAGGLDRIGTRAALAAAGGLTAVVTTAASFEQAFTGVEKTVEGTEAQLAALEGTLRQMARAIPLSFEELAGIGEAGGALGIARDSLDEFVDVVARLSVSTNLTSDQAATALGQLGTILHLSGKDFEDFADSLVALGNAGASTEDQIVELAARFAAAGNSAGLSKEEILALASATASMGIEVEAGGTALSQTFNRIATGIGTGSKEIEAFTETLGISAAEFKERWTQDALGTFQAFLGELSKLDQFEQAEILTRAGITGARQLSAVKLMTQNIGFLSEQLKISENATGALDKESQKFFDTTQGQWVILKNNVRDTAATIGSELLPVANELIKDFVGFLQAPGSQSGLKDFAKDLAAGIRGLVTELKGTDFSGIISGLKLAAQVAKTAFDAFRALPEPIQQLAIAALVANKVTGGAVGDIAKGLGNIIFGAGGLFARGSSPANPMWVAAVGGLGGTVPGLGAGPGSRADKLGTGVGNVLKFVLLPAAAVAIGAEIAAVINERIIGPAAAGEAAKVQAVLDSKSVGSINDAINRITAEQNTDDILAQTALIASNIPFIGDALGHVGPKLDEQRRALEDARAEIVAATQNSSSASNVWSARQLAAFAGLTNEQRNAASASRATAAATSNVVSSVNAARSAIGRGFSELGGVVRSSKNNLRVTVNVTSSIAISETLRRITSARVATGTISEF